MSKQAFITAAATFVRNACTGVPTRAALEVFIDSWIDANVPKDFGLANQSDATSSIATWKRPTSL